MLFLKPLSCCFSGHFMVYRLVAGDYMFCLALSSGDNKDDPLSSIQQKKNSDCHNFDKIGSLLNAFRLKNKEKTLSK